MNFATALSFKEKKMTKAPLPDSVRIGQVSLAVFQTVIFFLKSNFFHFWAKNCISRVKLFEICLISSAKPFFLSAFFLRRPFHAENMVQTILWTVSRLRAAFADLRFTLSCKRLTSSCQCMLSMDQWLRTIAPGLGVSAGRLLTYSRFHSPEFV